MINKNQIIFALFGGIIGIMIDGYIAVIIGIIIGLIGGYFLK